MIDDTPANLKEVLALLEHCGEQSASEQADLLEICLDLVPVLDPLRATILHRLGLAYEALGELIAAENALQEALAIALADCFEPLAPLWTDVSRIQLALGNVHDGYDSLVQARSESWFVLENVASTTECETLAAAA